MTVLALGWAALVGCGTTARTSPASRTSSPPASAVSPAPVRVDRALLAHLPREVGGVSVEFSAEGSAEAVASSGGSGAEALVYAVATDAQSGDLVVATVVRPGSEGVDDAAVRRLRDTYAAGVCGGESQVRGNAEAELGGRTVHIATCAGGGHAYSTRLEQSRTIVLAFSRGEARLGEELMARLRDR